MALPALCAIILAWIGWQIGSAVPLLAATGFGALAIAVVAGPILVWAAVRTVDLAAWDGGSVFAAVNGDVAQGAARTGVRVTVTDGQIAVVPLPGQPDPAVPPFAVGDVTSLTWASHRTLHRQIAQVRIHGTGREPVALRLICSSRSSDLKHLRRTLLRVLPEGAMPGGNRTTALIPAWTFAPLTVTIVALFAVAGSIGQHEPPISRFRTAGAPQASASAEPTSGAGPTTDLPSEAPADYLPMTADGQPPPTVGRPWGRACAPLTLELGTLIPRNVGPNAHQVIQELVGSVPVSITLDQDGKRTLFGPPPGGVSVAFPVFPIAAISAADPEGTDGLVTWVTHGEQSQASFDWIRGGMPARASDVLTRKVLRLMLARSFGLMYSVALRTGLARDAADSIDGFTPADLHALGVFSGCLPVAQ